MNARTSIVAGGAAAALITGSCLLALPASAGSATHTLKFTAHNVSNGSLGKKGGVAFDHDKHAGKLVGYDIVTFVGRTTGDAAVGLPGGLLLAHLTFTKSGLTGTVIGGTGKYHGAKGNVSGQAVTKNATKVTITYHL
jgi:hypothetical protein